MSSKRFLACFTGVLLLCASIASAQAPPAAPKPGPEHQELKYFVGKWTTEGEAQPSPMGPGGKFTMTDNCEMFSGNFFVVCRSSGKGPRGPSNEIGILGYDTKKKAYSYYGINNHEPDAGMGESKGKSGDTWVWTTAPMEMPDGKKMQGRFTMSNMTPNSYDFKFETAAEGSNDWKTMSQGKATKGGGAAKPKTEGETKPKT